MDNKKICACCGKPAEGLGSVEIGVKGNFTPFCSLSCFNKHMKENAKLVKTLADRKELLARKRKYKKERIKQVLSLDKVETNDDFYFLYESLTAKQRETFATKFFSHLIAKNNCVVSDILNEVESIAPRVKG